MFDLEGVRVLLLLICAGLYVYVCVFQVDQDGYTSKGGYQIYKSGCGGRGGGVRLRRPEIKGQIKWMVFGSFGKSMSVDRRY